MNATAIGITGTSLTLNRFSSDLLCLCGLIFRTGPKVAQTSISKAPRALVGFTFSFYSDKYILRSDFESLCCA